MSTNLSEDEKAELRYMGKRLVEIADRGLIEKKVHEKDAWRKETPSDKQIKILKEKGYAIEGLTRGQASDIIDRIFKETRK